MILHETKSVVVIATDSENRKTGPGKQLWILDRTQHPSDSRTSGDDSRRQCRGCPLSSYRGCYVMDMPLASIWHRYRSGGYSYLKISQYSEFFRGEYVRLGAYGNPSLIPLRKLAAIARVARRFTGYFHDWHLMKAERARAYGRFLMASVHPGDGPATPERASRLGLRWFSAGQVPGAIECLADTRGLTCAKCGLCDGNNRRSDLPNIWINPHGYQVKHPNLKPL